MKYKLRTFNKIVGTEFRVKNLLNLYISIAAWLVNTDTKHINDKNFRKWIQNSGIYSYRTQPEINRLKMLKLRIINRFKLISKTKSGSYKFNCDIEKVGNYVLNALTKIDGLSKNKDIEPCIAFKEMLDFMIKYPQLDDAKRIFRSFWVYTKEDNFFDLYNDDHIIKKIVDENVKPNDGYQYITDLSNGIHCSKPQNIKNICKKILNNKTQFKITSEEFSKAKRTFLTNFKEYKEFEKFVRESSYDDIAKIFVLNMINRNFHEFFDLFSRLLFSLGISVSSGTKVKYFLNNKIKKIDDSYFVEQNVDFDKYPYSLDEVNEILKKINNRNFEFVNKDENLSNLPHADIVEYFVNIKFCYLMKIPVQKCREFINTHLTDKLYPISHAPGKMSDMIFFMNNGKKLCSVETTIHKTITQIINHEFYPSISHLLKHKSKNTSYMLILVQRFDSDEKLVSYFNDHGKIECEKKNKTFELKTFNFEQLSNLINF